jgi:hypothetical protein
MKPILIAACLLLGGCGTSAAMNLEIMHSDENGIVIKAGFDTTPDRIATVHCQNLGRLMQPIRSEAFGTRQRIYYYACI